MNITTDTNTWNDTFRNQTADGATGNLFRILPESSARNPIYKIHEKDGSQKQKCLNIWLKELAAKSHSQYRCWRKILSAQLSISNQEFLLRLAASTLFSSFRMRILFSSSWAALKSKFQAFQRWFWSNSRFSRNYSINSSNRSILVSLILVW